MCVESETCYEKYHEKKTVSSLSKRLEPLSTYKCILPNTFLGSIWIYILEHRLHRFKVNVNVNINYSVIVNNDPDLDLIISL